MKLKSEYNNETAIPEIIIDISGKAIFCNQPAIDAFKIRVGSDVSKLVDIDEIKKLSMFSNKIDVLKTFHSKYKEATVIIFGQGINKSIKLTFRKGYEKSPSDILQEKNILSVASSVAINQDKKTISINELSTDIKKTVVENGYFLNTYVKDDSFYHKESHLQALILCSIAMMNETSPKKPVDLYISKNGENLEVKIIVRIETMKEARGAQAVEAMLPWCSLRIALIDSICDKDNISYSIRVVERQFKIVYKIPELKAESTLLRTFTISQSMLYELYTLLAPRENIALKYGKPGEEQEG